MRGRLWSAGLVLSVKCMRRESLGRVCGVSRREGRVCFRLGVVVEEVGGVREGG